jgi:hypothetical protein
MERFKCWFTCCFYDSNSAPNRAESLEVSNKAARNKPSLLRLESHHILENSGSCISIEVVESTVLEVGQAYRVKPNGVEGGRPASADGEVRFGTGVDGNSVVLPEEEGIGSSHFAVTYDIPRRLYSLKDLGQGSGTFVRLDRPHKLLSRQIISFGENHMGVLITDTHAGAVLGLKFLDGPFIGKQFDFTPTDSVKIGRTLDCQIKFESSCLSRVQCCIQFTVGQGWMLYDGHATRGSTNGTWLYIDVPYLIDRDTVFKAGQTMFIARLVTPQ